MKKDVTFTITSNVAIAKDVYQMELSGDTSDIFNPGQFVNIQIESLYLRRPISVCDYDDNYIKLIYKVVGKGTDKLSTMVPNEKLNILTGLGNGYDTSKMNQEVLLVGGGVGVPPMYGLAKRLISQGRTVKVVLGYNSKSDVFYEDEFNKLGCETYVCTVDGSYGTKGMVTDVIKEKGYEETQYCACGPLPMLKALKKLCKFGYMSLEARMGCGFGACMGCSIQTKYGTKRVCKEGPVFESEELLWED